MNDASAKTALPGLLLALTGVATLLLSLLLAALQVLALLPPLMAALDQGVFVSSAISMGMSTGPGLVFLAAGMAGALVTVMAGLRLRALRSPSLVMAGAVVAMLPCCSICCPLGLLAGGWALYVLQDDDVRAAMADA